MLEQQYAFKTCRARETKHMNFRFIFFMVKRMLQLWSHATALPQDNRSVAIRITAANNPRIQTQLNQKKTVLGNLSFLFCEQPKILQHSTLTCSVQPFTIALFEKKKTAINRCGDRQCSVPRLAAFLCLAQRLQSLPLSPCIPFSPNISSLEVRGFLL